MTAEGFITDTPADHDTAGLLHVEPPVRRAVRLPRMEESALIAAARDGDAAALRALLDSVSGVLLRYGQTFCRHPEDAEDVMQDVLTALARTLQSFRGDASLSTWAYTAARRACARNRRKRSHQPGAFEPLDDSGAHAVADVAPDPHANLERAELAAGLSRAIDALPPAYREVVLLRDIEGLSAEEAAAIIGINVRALKSRLHRARLLVREAMEPFAAGLATIPASPRAGGRRQCPDVLRMLSKHREGDVSGPLCARLETHVKECARCSAACDSLRRVLGACRAFGDQEVPEELLAAYRRAIDAVVREVAED